MTYTGDEAVHMVGAVLRAEIFDEHARLSAFENDGSRAFNIGGLTGMGESGYAGLSPVQWPLVRTHAGSKRKVLWVGAHATHIVEKTIADVGESRDHDITNAGTFMGSPHYIAPEQARNQNPDQRCDIYSLGVLLHHMLTGKVPFTAANPVDIIMKHLHDPPPPIRQVRPELNLHPELEAIAQIGVLVALRVEGAHEHDGLVAHLILPCARKAFRPRRDASASPRRPYHPGAATPDFMLSQRLGGGRSSRARRRGAAW